MSLQFTETFEIAFDAAPVFVPNLIGDADAAQNGSTVTDTLNDVLAVAASAGIETADMESRINAMGYTADFIGCVRLLFRTLYRRFCAELERMMIRESEK